MLIDITGVMLIPGNDGKECPGNGECFDKNGIPIECCCDACDYAMCCYEDDWSDECATCDEWECPRNPMNEEGIL